VFETVRRNAGIWVATKSSEAAILNHSLILYTSFLFAVS